jgi:hypothetical protein
LMLIGVMSPPAHAEVNVALEFRTSLEPHGRWTQNDRWGDVWIPAHIEKDWAPYTRGHWVYTDDWGWYWVSEETEAEWGWAVYHYGRWFFDPAEGWIWIPGREWAPAWVTWRRGTHRIGWAPQPPDEVYVEIRDNPRYWVFVEATDFTSDRLWTEIEPGWHHTVFLQETVIVNRTVIIRERGFAVNPGIEPAVIAREVGEPIRTYEVSPVVLEGTADIEGAFKVRPEDAPAKAKEQRVQQTSNVVEPAKTEEAPQALAPDESGRLGERPPRAAKKEGGEPSEKAAEETKPGEKGKTVEQLEQPGKPKAAEETKPGEKGKTVEQPEQPGKPKAAEETKPGQKGKTVERPEQPGKAQEEGKSKQGKNAPSEGAPEQLTPKGKAAPKGAEGKQGALEHDEEQLKPKAGKKAATDGESRENGKATEKPRAAQEGSSQEPGKGAGAEAKAKPGKKAAKEGQPQQPSEGGPPL